MEQLDVIGRTSELASLFGFSFTKFLLVDLNSIRFAMFIFYVFLFH
jgi:hypothetical protein